MTDEEQEAALAMMTRRLLDAINEFGDAAGPDGLIRGISCAVTDVVIRMTDPYGALGTVTGLAAHGVSDMLAYISKEETKATTNDKVAAEAPD